MLINKFNHTTEAALNYYKKIVELEGALIAFNMDLAQRKLNELEVVTFKLGNSKADLTESFESETGLQWTEENYTNYCAGNMSLEIASKNLVGYLDGAQRQLKTLKETLNTTLEVTEKLNNAENALTKKKNSKGGAWSRKANKK